MSHRPTTPPAFMLLLGALGSGLVACSASSTNTFGGGGASSTSSGAGGSSSTGAPGEGGSIGAGLFDGGFADAGGGGETCAKETQFVYTLTADNLLLRFDPPTLIFTVIGTVDCGSFATPYSMAVDRNGQGWTVLTDGSLHQIDTKTAKCTATSFVPGQHGFNTFGMGFSTDDATGAAETLFVSQADLGGSTTLGLAKIDLGTMTLTPIGMYDKVDARAELTGTGDGRLFGAFEGSPYDVAQISKTDAEIESQAPQSALNYPPGSSNFAFAFWGGDFFLFVGPGTSTDVFLYEPATGKTTLKKTVPLEIVGAGVSTCAPTKPPS